MKSAILLVLLAAVAVFGLSESEYQGKFTSWMQSNKKSYHHDEFQARYQIFKANLDYIDEYNAQNTGVTLAMNHLGDLTLEEFKKFYLGTPFEAKSMPESPIPLTKVDAPDSWDWRDKGVVTPVKDQGQCGSCWSFSTTGSTEGCHAITTKQLVSLSEQQLVDCSSSFGNEGCNGGLMTSAMKYIISVGGLDTEKDYPYTARDGSCHFNKSGVAATLKNFVNVASGSESDLQTKVYTGPTSVAIDAGHSSFQFYSSGVYYEPACSPTRLDHGVLAVGWGTTSDGKDYWIVKNSWSASWGNAGYIWMSRNRNNNCGIATMATLPEC